MALHPNFPRSPCEVLPLDLSLFPAPEEFRRTAYEKLLAPLIAKVRAEVDSWRAEDSPTSRAPLSWRFNTDIHTKSRNLG
jgi:type III restriction enzyme